MMTNKNYDVKKIERSRKLKFGSSAIIIMISAIIVFVMINLMASWATFEVDLTPEKLYSIGDQTKAILKEIDKEVQIYGFIDETRLSDDSYHWKIIDLLKKYDTYDNITVDYIEPNANIEFINELDPDGVLDLSKNNYVVVCGDYKKVLKYFDLFDAFASEYSTYGVIDTGSRAEMAITSAINYVSKTDRTNIAFTTGHEEFTSQYDYIAFAEKLELNGFIIDEVNLYKQPITDETDIIIIANPTSDFYQEEIVKLQSFMAEGKSLYILMDSFVTNDRFLNLQEFLLDYNVQLNYDKVKEYDTSFYLEGNQYYLIPELINNSISNDIFDGFSNMMVPNARSITVLKVINNNLTIVPMLITSDKAKLEGLYEDIDDVTGAAYLAAAILDENTGSRLMLSGTASFIQDQVTMSYEQFDQEATKYVLSNIQWLEGDTGEIFIEQKDYFINFISITTKQANTIGGLLVYGLPSLILLAGLLVYLRRRHL